MIQLPSICGHSGYILAPQDKEGESGEYACEDKDIVSIVSRNFMKVEWQRRVLYANTSISQSNI